MPRLFVVRLICTLALPLVENVLSFDVVEQSKNRYTLFSPTKRRTNGKRFPYLTLVSWVVLGERVFPFVVFLPFVALHCFAAQVAFPQPLLLTIPTKWDEDFSLQKPIRIDSVTHFHLPETYAPEHDGYF